MMFLVSMASGYLGFRLIMRYGHHFMSRRGLVVFTLGIIAMVTTAELAIGWMR